MPSLMLALLELPSPWSEPFVCPLQDYRTMHPGGDVPAPDWVEALIRATFVRIASHPALFLVDQSQALLDGMEILAGMDVRSKRMLMLLQALNAASSVEPIILHWSADMVSKFENLPGQFPDKGLS